MVMCMGNSIVNMLTLLMLWIKNRKAYDKYWDKRRFVQAIYRLKEHCGKSEDVRTVLKEARK